jgi:hypothetical protein
LIVAHHLRTGGDPKQIVELRLPADQGIGGGRRLKLLPALLQIDPGVAPLLS